MKDLSSLSRAAHHHYTLHTTHYTQHTLYSIHGSSLYIQGAYCCVIHLVQFDRVVEVDAFLSLLLPGTKIVNIRQPPHSGEVKNSQNLSIRGETSLPAAWNQHHHQKLPVHLGGQGWRLEWRVVLRCRGVLLLPLVAVLCALSGEQNHYLGIIMMVIMVMMILICILLILIAFACLVFWWFSWSYTDDRVQVVYQCLLQSCVCGLLHGTAVRFQH